MHVDGVESFWTITDYESWSRVLFLVSHGTTGHPHLLILLQFEM